MMYNEVFDDLKRRFKNNKRVEIVELHTTSTHDPSYEAYLTSMDENGIIQVSHNPESNVATFYKVLLDGKALDLYVPSN